MEKMQMENAKHYFMNNIMVLNEKLKGYFPFLRQMPSFFLEHVLIVWQRYAKPSRNSYILMQVLRFCTNDSPSFTWDILWVCNSCLFTFILQDAHHVPWNYSLCIFTASVKSLFQFKMAKHGIYLKVTFF